jgi:hypothetical protein
VDDLNPHLKVFDALQPASRSSSVVPPPSGMFFIIICAVLINRVDTNEPHEDSEIEELCTAPGTTSCTHDLFSPLRSSSSLPDVEEDSDLLKSDMVWQDGRKFRVRIRPFHPRRKVKSHVFTSKLDDYFR